MILPLFTDTSLSDMFKLKRLRGHIVQFRMKLFRIVMHFDVVKEVLFGIRRGQKIFIMDRRLGF